MRRLLPFLLALSLAACKGSSPEKDLVGPWSSPQQKVRFAADKTFTATPGEIAGAWSVEGRDVTLTVKTIGGRPVAELKAMLQKSLGLIPADRRAQAESQLRTIDQPNVATLSDDGKTLTPKARGTAAMAPLTKG